MTKLWAGQLRNWGLIQAEAKNFSVLLSIQIGPEAFPASYANDPGSFFCGKVTAHIHPVPRWRKHGLHSVTSQNMVLLPLDYLAMSDH